MRVVNFSAGPSVLPESVLEQAAREMLDQGGSGMSVMEMSHRSNAFETIMDDARHCLSRLLNLPENYEILFLQGGATTQFSAVPLNLMTGSGKADYVISGSWAKKAKAEAARYGDALAASSSEAEAFRRLPSLDGDWYRKDADYVHLTTNNTIVGTALQQLPDCDVPLVLDMSSDILSQPIDVSKVGLIYAGAQKNAGPAGLTLVIIRKDLIGRAHAMTPLMLDYATHAKKGSLYNTPPTYAIYIAGLVYRWLEDLGGVLEMEKRNRAKADLLYTFLDQSQRFSANVPIGHRSRMNVTFSLTHADENRKFIEEAAQAGFVNLAGHRSVGGMRASLYNALPLEAVERLVDFMTAFERAA